MKNNIEMISIEKLYPHPQNPRKELGDLTELSESIKESGIFQNLTVVMHPTIADAYMVIIGHRRLGAAKLAGLTELPCAIVEMDEKEQLATMLLENMQRCDLTILEQAQGIQMMLDLGESVEQISQKTGLSKSTIYKRKNIMELDADKTKEALERGATLMDFMELEKVKDPERKNAILEKMGTKDFEWTVKSEIRKEKEQENSAKIRAVLATFATECERDYSIHESLTNIYKSGDNIDIEIPSTENGEEYFFKENSWGFDVFVLKQEKEETDEEKKKRIESEKTQRRWKQLSGLCKQSYEMRKSFILELSNNNIRKKMKEIQAFLVLAQLRNASKWKFKNDFEEITGIKYDEKNSKSQLELYQKTREELEYNSDRNILISTFLLLDYEDANFLSWKGEYDGNPHLEETYRFVEMLGYQCSEEEMQLRNGTHPLYWKE